MTYDVLITRESEHQFTARVLTIPGVVISGSDEQDVLAQVREKIGELRANSYLVRLELPPASEAVDPWLQFAGMWRDDPNWDVFQEEVAAYHHSFDNDTTE